MPERAIINLPRQCKFETRRKGEVIKIDESVIQDKKLRDKEWNKRIYGKEKVDFTKDVEMYVTREQADKLEEFTEYIDKIDGCVHCGHEIAARYIKSNEANEIEMQCKDHCMGTQIDSTKESKEYVVWFNSLLSDYGLSFKDGFPPAIRCTYGTKCDNCGGSHDGARIFFDFT